MKKIFALILALMLCFALPIAAYAEDVETGEVSEEVVGEDNSTPETETSADGEIPASEKEEIATEWDHIKNLFSENFEEWILSHLEEISVVVTLIMTCFYNMRKHKLLNKSMGTLNNNAITVAKESSNFMSQALTNIENASGTVTSLDANIVALLEAYKVTAEDKAKLEKELVEIKNYLKTSTKANIEFADELAELLGLANIPNYKKEEIGARHVAAKKEIIEAEEKAEAAALLPTNTEEVKEDVGEEKKD